jgi:hypothetical protein
MARVNERWRFGYAGSQLVSKQRKPVQMQLVESKVEERDRLEQVFTWDKNAQ